MSENWFSEPTVQSGIMSLQNDAEGGPQYAVGVVAILPNRLIEMQNSLHFINRNFNSVAEAEAEDFCYRAEHVDWTMAERNGLETVHIARQMQDTPGVRWLYIYPWGMMVLGWKATEKYFPDILTKMQKVLSERYGEIEFINVPEREMFFPTSQQSKANEGLGVNLPI